MSVINKRNALLGWAVWEVGKRSAKYKARRAIPGSSNGSRVAVKGAVATGLAAAGGALWVWRRRRSDETPTIT
jgi:hypothetical protein